ncbi:MAG: HNH endonuclease [Armatimonadetes bacterium]|nr:HNH endonuclease [Armatimonadota bacterium]
MSSRSGNSARDKLRTYFLNRIGQVLDADELRALAGISEWARRIRELRNEEGYHILTHADRSDLKPGQYVLASPIPNPAFERSISKEIRAYVLDRNGFTCQMCGAVAGEPHPYDSNRKTRLHIGHIVDKSLGGTNDATNLRALCSVCNEGAANLTLDRPSARRLLVQIRRANLADQRAVLDWLVSKFPDAQRN